MKTSKRLLFDTNVLIYNQDVESIFYQRAAFYHDKASSKDLSAVVSSQNLLEFTAVITSPKKITKPLSQKKAALEIEKYLTCGFFEMIYPTKEAIRTFVRLLKKYPFKNPKRYFDLFLVATMLASNVKKILTANDKDFREFSEIEVIRLNEKSGSL